MQYTDDAIHRSLNDRLRWMHGEPQIERAFRDLATDLIGATDPADLPADCRAWVDGVIGDTAAVAAHTAIEQLLVDLARRLAAAPDDLGQCDLMQAVARAQSIHVTEVR